MASLSGTSPPVALIVEDDELQRSLACMVVEEAGCVALEAGDADEAIALLESRPDISVLFTDVQMPGSMDGLELAHAARRRWPSIKIVIVSARIRMQPCELPSSSCFVGKPYSSAALVAQLRSMVASA
jgi:two-component system, response regulator PdtaR